MISPGHPFSKPFQDLIDSLESSVREGVEQPTMVNVAYRSGTPRYEIRGPVHDILRVTGLRRRRFAVFERDVHYRYASGRLVWLEPVPPGNPDWYPDDNSLVAVEYTYRDLPSGITDFNAGSVAATFLRAVARELKFLYEEMDQAYRRAFIDIAEGEALDNVVALLGIVRNRAIPAEGFVTFFLKKAPRAEVVIAAKTRVSDAKGRLFTVTERGSIVPETEEAVRHAGPVIRTANRIDSLVHVREVGASVDLATVSTLPNQEFGESERTITLADPPSASDLLVRYRPKSVRLPVIAVEPGPDGNLGPGSLTVMPTPPRGVDGGVVNEDALAGGEAQEGDEPLRARAKHELERSGNATVSALRYAILDVDGVEGVEVRDHDLDESIPLGEVRIRYSGGNEADVLAAIDDTRAAGIRVRAEVIATVFVSGVVHVMPDVGYSDASAQQLEKEIIAALEGLRIGEAAYVRRITSMAYQVPGLADVAEARLDYAKRRAGEPGPFEEGPVVDPLVVGPGELVRPAAGSLSVRGLAGLKVSAVYVPASDRTELTISVLNTTGVPVRFRSFRLNVRMFLKARLKTEPGQPLERVAQMEHEAIFTDATTAVIVVPDSTIIDAPGHPGFRLGPDGHEPAVEFQVSATAYPGLKSGEAPVDLTGIG